MQVNERIQPQIQRLKPVDTSPALAQRVWSLIDYTSLNETDTEESVAAFFEKARTPFGLPAAVCINPGFVRMAVAEFSGTAVKVATVVNFPTGTATLEATLIEITRALQDGAQEIDLVFPYQHYLQGERATAISYVEACKAACGDKVVLKVILETGALNDVTVIYAASKDMLAAGADMIKTSTGKIPQGTTLEAAAAMLLAIQDSAQLLNRPVGLKVSGGIRDIHQASQYIELADNMFGAEVTPKIFRIGASKLLDEILSEL